MTRRPGPLLGGLMGPDLPGAACAGLAPLHDDVIDGESPGARTARLAHARAVCTGCRVRAVCLEAAGTDAVLHPSRGVSGMLAGHVHPEVRSARHARWHAALAVRAVRHAEQQAAGA